MRFIFHRKENACQTVGMKLNEIADVELSENVGSAYDCLKVTIVFIYTG